MNPLPLQELLGCHFRLEPLMVDQYHHMIPTGILVEGAPIELLGGLLVRKDRGRTGGDPKQFAPEQAFVLNKLAGLNPRLRRRGCHICLQQPLTLPPYDEPEPDGAIVRGRLEDFRGRHPGGEDVLCVIEVADSSLAHDRTTKQRIYADHGIPQYVLVNLVEGVIEVYSEPRAGCGRYGRLLTLGLRQRVEFNTGGKVALVVAARTLLP